MENKLDIVVTKMREKDYLLNMGAGKLAQRFNTTRETIYKAKEIVRGDVKKSEPNLQLKSKWQTAGGEWRESYKVTKTEEDIVTPEQILQVIKDNLVNVEPIEIIPLSESTFGLNIWISDEHIGADTKSGLFDNKYDIDEIKLRFAKILQQISKLLNVYKRFDALNIGLLGDTFDGWDGETTRGGHKLPQSMSNRGAFDTFLSVYLGFVEKLIQMNPANQINFYAIANSNHGGDFDYIAYKTLQMYLAEKYPFVNFTLFEKFLNHFHYGVHTYIITHGKDQINRRKGLPLQINVEAKEFIGDYIKLNPQFQPHIHVVKGDLHRSNYDLDRLCSSQSSFTYKNVGSVFGASSWIMENYGATMPIVDYEIVEKYGANILHGQIFLK